MVNWLYLADCCCYCYSIKIPYISGNVESHEIMLKQNNEIKKMATAIQAKLGIKVKLTQHEEEKHMWTSRFIFDKNENDSEKYVIILCDSSNNTFKCK